MKSTANKAFKHIIVLIKEQLKLPLPGKDAHYIMTPKSHNMEQRFSFDKDSVRKAAILMLLYLKDDEIKTVLIKRTAYNGIHSNQISFPGGKFEDYDLSLYDTACRETYEEIGINSKCVKYIGRISDLYIPPSNFLVSPFIAYTDEIPLFKTDPTEVESILEVGLGHLFDESVVVEKLVYTSGSINIIAPCYYINDTIIWGATAMMISELKVIIDNIPEAASILQS